MILFFNPVIPGDLLFAGGRAILFILIAAVVSFLTTRLQEIAMQFRGVTERSSDIVILTDTIGRATYVSPSIKKIMGWEPAELIGKQPVDFIPPDHLDLLRASIMQITKEKLPVEITVPFRRKDGDYSIIEFLGAPIIQGGSVAGIQVIGRDVTERKHIEDARREVSQRLAEIIEVLPDPTMVIDKAGSIIAWNRAMEMVSGIPASEILGNGGKSYTQWISNDPGSILINYVLLQDIDGIQKAYPNVRFEGNTARTEQNIIRTDGTRFSLWISATPLIDKNGEVTGAIETLRDVTALKKVQRALQESNVYLDSVINTLADPLFIKDRDHRFVKVNNAFCDFSGHTREELLGKSDYDFFKKEEADIFREKDEEVFRTRRENENEENITDSMGNTHTISTKKNIYTNTYGQEFIVGIIRDITERKRAEAALHITNKKLNLLSGITRHDIKNQLMALNAYISLSEDSIGKPDELREFIDKEQKIADAIAHQISFTKDYEDLGVQAPVWQNVTQIIRTVITRLPMRNVHVDAGDPGLEIFADSLLEKVFYNLIDNALRYGGEKMTTIRVTDREDNGVLTITVSDDGEGISSGDKTQLFTRGFGKHTGLGLYLSREILAITDITISETGEPGTGARFEITVPKGAWRSAGKSDSGI
ncbi:MAG: PAS domain S-box protein [Methanoregula sp.]